MKYIATRDFSQGPNNPLKMPTAEAGIRKGTVFYIGGETPCDKYGEGLSADNLKIFRMFAGTGAFAPFDSDEAKQVLADIERAKTPRERRADGFKTFNRRELLSMDDKKLAEWQSGFQADEPQWRLAEYEWHRRKDRGTSIRGWIAIGVSLLSLVVAVIALLRK